MTGSGQIVAPREPADRLVAPSPASAAGAGTAAAAAPPGPETAAAPGLAASPAAAASASSSATADQGADLAIDTEPGHDDPTSDEAHVTGQPEIPWVPRAREETPGDGDGAYGDSYPAAGLSAAPTIDFVPEADLEDTADDLAVGQFDESDEVVGGQPAPSGNVGGQQAQSGHEVAASQPADTATEAQSADEDTPARPYPAPLPQFRRKWSSPTPPEDD